MQGSRIHSRNGNAGARAGSGRVACLCCPLCPTNTRPGVHVDAVAQRRPVVTGSPIGRSPRVTLPAGEWGEAPWTSSFRRRTPNEDLLLRRFVLEEEATRRRRVMEVAAERYGRMWLPPPPSRLSLMSVAGYDDMAEDEEIGSALLRGSEDQPL